MEKFDLHKHLQDKSRKIVTRNGIEAEIIHYKDPLVAIINNVAYNFDNDGKLHSYKAKHEYDLFFADEENTKMTEFETRIYNLINFSGPYNYPSIKEVKEEAEILLDLARNELTQDISDFEIYEKSFKNGKEYALESLPKWKKATEYKYFDKPVLLFNDNENIVLTPEIYKDEYYIERDDLKILPKEK
jgi:hypothetical protein